MKLVYFILILLFLSGCSQSDTNGMKEYLDDSTSYDIDAQFNDEILTIEIPMENIREDFVQNETRILLQAIKSYPGEEVNIFKEIKFSYYEKDTKKPVADIKISGENLLKYDWEQLDSISEIPEKVDTYYYKS